MILITNNNKKTSLQLALGYLERLILRPHTILTPYIPQMLHIYMQVLRQTRQSVAVQRDGASRLAQKIPIIALPKCVFELVLLPKWP